MEELSVVVLNGRVLQSVLGSSDEHLRKIRKALGARVTVDADKISGIFTRKPGRNELPNEIQESQIIAYYHRKL